VPLPVSKATVLWALLSAPPTSGFELCATLTEATCRRCTPGALLPTLVALERARLLAVDRTADPYRYSLTPQGITAAYEAGPGQAFPAVLMMADLVGFTRFTERHGDTAAHEQASRLARTAKATVAPLGGALVKSLGDGVMLCAPPDSDPVGVLRTLANALAATPPAWQVHAGAHAGAPIRHAGDVFGRDVNLVARLCAHARPGEVLLTAPDGEVSLRVDGFEEPVAVRRVVL